MVISAGYRLAPETRYPGPMIDCYDVTAWAAREAESLVSIRVELPSVAIALEAILPPQSLSGPAI